MKRHRHYHKRKIGGIFVGIGATMLILMLIPLWVWWFFVGLGFLAGGVCLLKQS